MSFLLDFKDRIMEDAAIDDGVDRANRQYTVILFLIILIFLGLKQFVGDPIECFTPQYFSEAQENYVNAYCWTASTYQIMKSKYDAFRSFQSTDVILRGDNDDDDDDDDFGETELKGTKKFVSYYQWIPIIISMQAFLFYAPHLVWTSLVSNSGVHIKSFLTGAQGLEEIVGKKEERLELLEDLAEQFKRYIKVTRKLAKSEQSNLARVLSEKITGIGMKNGNFLCFVYLMTKLLYVFNCFGQLYGLHKFLHVSIIEHGFSFLKGVVFNSDWVESPRFPINTICEFRGQPQLHGYLLSYTCHCVLPINLYNDKIYAIVSLYLLGLLIFTALNFVIWLRKIVWTPSRTQFILHYLEVNHRKEQATEDGVWEEMWKDFTEKRLRPDGIFIMMLVEFNLGNVTADQIIIKLWDEAYKDFKKKAVNQLSINGPSFPFSPGNNKDDDEFLPKKISSSSASAAAPSAAPSAAPAAAAAAPKAAPASPSSSPSKPLLKSRKNHNNFASFSLYPDVTAQPSAPDMNGNVVGVAQHNTSYPRLHAPTVV